MTHNDKDTELYDKAEELIEQKPEFAEGETYGQVTISDVENAGEDRSPGGSDTTFDEFNQAEEMIVEKPTFAEGETYGEVLVTDEGDQEQTDSVSTASEAEDTPIFTDTESLDESVPEDSDHDHPQEHIGLMPLNRINHPLR